MTPLQKMPKNVVNLDKFIVAKGFKKLPKVQKIARSGHTAGEQAISYLAMRILPLKSFIHTPTRSLSLSPASYPKARSYKENFHSKIMR